MISKDEFILAYSKYPPNAWTKFAFKYFSTNTKQEDKWLSNTVTTILIIFFIIGGGFSVSGIKHTIVGIPVFLFCGGLLSLGILMLGAVFMNNRRIKKIRKILNISQEQYDMYADMYL